LSLPGSRIVFDCLEFAHGKCWTDPDRKPKLDVSSTPAYHPPKPVVSSALEQQQQQPCFFLRNGTFDRGILESATRRGHAGAGELATVRHRACAQEKGARRVGRRQVRSECACHKYRHHPVLSTGGRHTVPCLLAGSRLQRCLQSFWPPLPAQPLHVPLARVAMPQTALAGSLASGYKAGGTSSPVSVHVPSGSLGVTGERERCRAVPLPTCDGGNGS